MSAGGGKEIHFDSSSLRAQFDAGGAAQVDVTDPAYVPEIVTGPTPTPRQLAENIPSDVLKAMANGGTPSPESIRALMTATPALYAPAGTAAPTQRPIFTTPMTAAVELTIPVGAGITARVSFTSQPSQAQWKKLIRHLEIEAEDADEIPAKQPDLAALADAALRRAASDTGTAVVAPNTKRRGRRSKTVVAPSPESPRE